MEKYHNNYLRFPEINPDERNAEVGLFLLTLISQILIIFVIIVDKKNRTNYDT